MASARLLSVEADRDAEGIVVGGGLTGQRPARVLAGVQADRQLSWRDDADQSQRQRPHTVRDVSPHRLAPPHVSATGDPERWLPLAECDALSMRGEPPNFG